MNYLILANVYMAVFYAFYAGLLKKETFFQYNRIYLTGTLLLSYLLPLIQFSWIRQWFSESPMQQARASFDEVLVVTASSPAAVNRSEAWPPILVIYWAGVAIMTLWLCLRVYLLVRQLSQPQARQSFSFLHLVRVDQAQAGAPVIWQHEQAHVRYLHSLDVIFSELALLFSWFNPVAYLYRKSIKLQHEYQADAYVAASGQDPAGYAEILLSNAFQVPMHTLTNPFNQQSFIKNRIIMLFKEKSKRTALLKYAFAAPLFAGMIVFSSARTPEINLAETLANHEQLPSTPASVQPQNIGVVDSSVTVDVRAEPRGGFKQYYQTIVNNFQYSQEAVDHHVKGTIVLSVVINTEGALENIKPVKDPGYGTTEEAIRLIKTLPKWLPAVNNLNEKKENRKVNETRELFIPVDASPIIRQDTTKGKKIDYTEVEIRPDPPGGMPAFLQFIGDNYNYPKEAIDHKVTGKVVLEFVVAADGSLSDITVLRDLGYGTGEEAKRVLGLSKNWKPGIQDGKPVRVQFTLPIALAASKS